MTETRQAWDEVANRFEDLGLKLKRHFEQASAGDDAEEVLRRLGSALEQAFDALGQAARDPGVQSDVAAIGRSLGDALSSSLAEINDRLRECFSDGRNRQHPS